MEELIIYHTSKTEIQKPDIKIGRRNADFSKGFYTSLDLEFNKKWADESSIINIYKLTLDNLKIKKFDRSLEWYEYIYNNRMAKSDYLSDYDLIIGPISNDTIYDTWGILTSGLIEKEKALKILMLGPNYTQVVIKTNKALDNLRFIESIKVDPNEITKYKDILRKEESAFQEQFTNFLNNELEGTID